MKTLLFLLLSLSCLAEPSSRESVFSQMAITTPPLIEGREVIRGQHESSPDWGYQRPQKDYFYLVAPLKPAKNAPLRVVLHSAGHSGDKIFKEAFTKRRNLQYYGSDDFYILYLDCRKNKGDWWWGYHGIKRKTSSYKNELYPTEKRVMATVEWVIQEYNINRDRVYLSGVSMGGSGSLGIGINHGDVFAAINVAVPAGVDHIFHRHQKNQPDPPVIVDFSSHVDRWSKGQGRLLDLCRDRQIALYFTWGTFGHSALSLQDTHPGVFEFPWLEIKKNEAYPVFTNASTDHTYPGFNNTSKPDQEGQINGFFRWKNITDTEKEFIMELTLIHQTQSPVKLPAESIADVSFRRLQKWSPQKPFSWKQTVAGKVIAEGTCAAQPTRPTLSGIKITQTPCQITLKTLPESK